MRLTESILNNLKEYNTLKVGDNFGAAENYPDSGVYFVGTDKPKAVGSVDKYSVGTIVYFDQGGGSYSGPGKIIGYGTSNEDGTGHSFYAVRWQDDGNVSMQDDNSIISQEEYDNLDDEDAYSDNDEEL